MLAMAALNAYAWTATPLFSSTGSPQQLLRPKRVPLHLHMDGSNAPSLREQMKAYLKSVEERGVELTGEQKQMLAEFQEDDELLDQTGRVDFMKGAEVLSAEEFAAQQQQPAAPAAAAPVTPPPVPVPAAPSPAPLVMGAVATATAAPLPPAPAIDGSIDPTAARLWMAQAGELDSACGLLQGYADGSLDANGAKELRKVLSSLICTLAAA